MAVSFPHSFLIPSTSNCLCRLHSCFHVSPLHFYCKLSFHFIFQYLINIFWMEWSLRKFARSLNCLSVDIVINQLSFLVCQYLLQYWISSFNITLFHSYSSSLLKPLISLGCKDLFVLYMQNRVPEIIYIQLYSWAIPCALIS